MACFGHEYKYIFLPISLGLGVVVELQRSEEDKHVYTIPSISLVKLSPQFFVLLLSPRLYQGKASSNHKKHSSDRTNPKLLKKAL
jgi:hypothetical protein